MCIIRIFGKYIITVVFVVMFLQSLVGELFNATVGAGVSILLWRYVRGLYMMLEVGSVLDQFPTLFAGPQFTFFRILDDFHQIFCQGLKNI